MDGYGRHNGPTNNLDGWNNPETDRRGVQSFQGDHPLPSPLRARISAFFKYNWIFFGIPDNYPVIIRIVPGLLFCK